MALEKLTIPRLFLRGHLRRQVALAVVSLVMGGWLLGLEESPVDGAEADEAMVIVDQLGSEKYSERQAASRRLWEMGLAALPSLREACASENPEIRVRARMIVEDLELGIFVDTPTETVALLREFHSGGLEKKEEVLGRLRGDDQLLVRMRLLLSEENPEWREQFVREFAGTGDKVLDALRETGQLDEAEELLAILSIRSWAVHLLLEGHAEARAAQLTKEWDGGHGTVEPSQLCWLLLVTDQLEEAREVADQSGDAALQREVRTRQMDWSALLDAGEGEIGTNAVEKLGFRAWLMDKAGDAAGAREAIDELIALDLEDDHMADNRSASLLILGCFDEAARSYGAHGELDGNELSLYLERLDFGSVATRLGVEPLAAAVREEMEARIGKVLKDKDNDVRNSRRELFNLCRIMGGFLVRAGEVEDAKGVLLAARELVRDEVSYLSYLARTCRSAGFIEEAESMELEVLNLGGKTHQLSTKFPSDRNLAQFWWDFLRSQYPEEEVEETLDRVSGILEPPKGGGGKDPGDRVAEALKWVEKQGDTDRAKYYGALADHYEREKDWEAAAEFLRKQSGLSRKPATPLIEAGDMFGEQGQWAQAAVFYDEAEKLDPRNELAMYLHGRALVEGGRPDEGEARKARAVRMPLANASRRSTFASGLQRRGLADVARQQWEFIIKTSQNDDWNGMGYWTLRSTRMQLVSGISSENPSLGADYLESYLMSFLKTNTSMTPRSYLSYHSRIESLRFDACMAEGDVKGAAAHLRRAIRARLGDASALLHLLGRLAEAGGDEEVGDLHKSLAERYATAIKQFPRSAYYHSVLADVRFRMGDRERAAELAKRCVELDPDSAVYQSQLECLTTDGAEP